MNGPTHEQRRHLRRILATFVVVVVALPFVALGGAWSWVLVALLLVAAVGVREAVLLRRTVSRAPELEP